MYLPTPFPCYLNSLAYSQEHHMSDMNHMALRVPRIPQSQETFDITSPLRCLLLRGANVRQIVGETRIIKVLMVTSPWVLDG